MPAPRRRIKIVAVTSPAETHRLLRISFHGDSVRGSLDDGANEPHRFFGWLELLAAIAELRTDDQERGRPGAPSWPSRPG
jgi:hypothetical protein